MQVYPARAVPLDIGANSDGSIVVISLLAANFAGISLLRKDVDGSVLSNAKSFNSG